MSIYVSQAQVDADNRYSLGQQTSLAQQLSQNQDSYNRWFLNPMANAALGQTQTAYSLGNDQQQMAQRVAQMQEQIAQQQRQDTQRVQGLNLNIGQTQQDQMRYRMGLQQDLARNAYQRSVQQLPAQGAQATRILGY